MVTGLTFILILLLLSGSFSSLETALFSLSSTEKNRLRLGGGLSPFIPKVLEKPRELLTTVLLGNELVNVAIAILAGSLAYEIFQGYDVRVVYLLTLTVTTFFLLVFGEILPKNIAIRNRLLVSQALILPFRFFSIVMTPLRGVLIRLADRIVSLFGIKPQRRMIVEEELQALVEMGHREGTLEEFESTLIRNAIDFAAIPVSRIMTPRQKIVAIPDTFSLSQILKVLDENRYSRIPVYQADIDQVIGILHVKEILSLRLHESGGLRKILKPFAEIGPELPLSEVFGEFKRRRIHLGVVKGQDGVTVGLVTMDDLLRRLFP